jgi:hypothetical protein
MTIKRRPLSFILLACFIAAGSETQAGFNVQIDISDPGNAYSAYYSDVTAGVEAAAAAWGQYIDTASNPLHIQVNLGTADATASGGSLSHQFVGTAGGVSTYELGTIIKMVDGIDINDASADAVLNIGTNWLTNTIWWNPDPGSTTPPPSGKVDSHYVMMHELGHILGFIAYRDGAGNLPTDSLGRPYQTTYDALTEWQDGNLFFNGDAAKTAYGGLVPLTYGNYSHVGNNSPRPGSDLVNDVMNGVVSKSIHYELSGVDVGILADLGYSLTAAGRALVYGAPPPPTVPEPASIIAMVVGLSGVGAWRVATGRRRAA